MTMRALVTAVLAVLMTDGLLLEREAAPQSFAVYGGERYFTVEWERVDRGGRPTLVGYVRNDGTFDATDVRLRVETVDAAGAAPPDHPRIPGLLGRGSRLYFEVPVAAAPGYRVTVLSYDRVRCE
ncbi:MAG TPA: hypothetical protein VGL09_19020 [Methylomirabilota bacterium]|jgi:hypothetical protein